MPVTTDQPARAAAALASGNIAALPTETVYGLGGLATLPDAVRRIYSIKGRPLDHPVIVHIASAEDVEHWASHVPDSAFTLIEAFWPGPLTIVVPRSQLVTDAISGGQSTVALRSPAHAAFQSVLTELKSLGFQSPGIAAPSANRFGRVSPTCAADVESELGALLGVDDIILDGGPCSVGLESTIVLCGPDICEVARDGGVTREQLSAHVTLTPGRPDEHTRVPGSLDSHYRPDALVITVDNLDQVLPPANLGHDRVGLLALASIDTPAGWQRVSSPSNAADYAQSLYASLRRADQLKLELLVAVTPKSDGIGAAIRDRLTRAAARRTV